MFIDSLRLIIILFAVIVMYVVSGVTANVLVKKETFEWNRLWTGCLKALIACLSLGVLAFVSSAELIDLSELGFVPKTFITSGIVLYGKKLLTNIMELIGLNKDIINIDQITKFITSGSEDCNDENNNSVG